MPHGDEVRDPCTLRRNEGGELGCVRKHNRNRFRVRRLEFGSRQCRMEFFRMMRGDNVDDRLHAVERRQDEEQAKRGCKRAAPPYL